MPADQGRKRPARPEPEPSAARFTDALRTLVRIQADLTVRTMADAGKVTDSTVSRYVRGQNFPTSGFVDAVVLVALERLNLNSDYVTVDVYAELRYWQTAWVHADKTRLKAASHGPDAVPGSGETVPSHAPVESRWPLARGAVITVGSAIAAAYASARIGVRTARSASWPSRSAAHDSSPPASPSPAPSGSAPSVSAPSSSQQDEEPRREADGEQLSSARRGPEIWTYSKTHTPNSTSGGPMSSDALSPRTSRRRVWTYSEHVRKNNGN